MLPVYTTVARKFAAGRLSWPKTVDMEAIWAKHSACRPSPHRGRSGTLERPPFAVSFKRLQPPEYKEYPTEFIRYLPKLMNMDFRAGARI